MDMQHSVAESTSGGMSSLISIKDANNKLPCVFCKSPEVDEMNFGPLYSSGDLVTHYFCMLFSAGLHQSGQTDGDGILGFLLADILKEVRRSSRLKCTFCGKYGASIGCCVKSCRTAYHFQCGLANKVQYQFGKNFMTYCCQHYEPQNITIPEEEWLCPICISSVGRGDHPVMGSCCKGAVFHKECLKRMALNAGYFFKCPMCNASETFNQEMRFYGVFVPEQDASWEREPNAFQELYTQYDICDAENCLCPEGKDFDAEEGDFELARCDTCGAAGIHLKCGKLETIEDWDCEACSKFIEEAGLTKTKDMPATSSSMIETPAHLVDNSRLDLPDPSDRVQLSKVLICVPVKDHFPYNKVELQNYERQGLQELPDWRGYKLVVNIVDWLLPHHGQKSVQKPIMRKRNERLAHQSIPSALKRLNAPCVSLATSHPLQRKDTAKKKTRRKYSRRRWKRGVAVSKRKEKAHKETGQTKIEKQKCAELSGCKNSLSLSAGDVDTEQEVTVSSLPPAKRRKVVEFGHNIYASGVGRDIYVQRNEVVIETHVPTDNGTGYPVVEAVNNDVIEQHNAEVQDLDRTVSAGDLEISHGDIFWEHSYSKFVDKNTRKSPKVELMSVRK